MKLLSSVIKSVGAMAIASGAVLSAAAADTGTNGWHMTNADSAESIYAQSAEGPTMTLNCSDRLGIQAFVYLNGNGPEELAIEGKPSVKSRNVTLQTDATDEKDDDWAYIRSDKILVSIKPWQARRIYNAVVTGSPISMDIRRVGEYTLTLPGVDDGFKAFTSSCVQ